MSYPRHYTIDHYLNKVRQHTEPYLAEICGKEIIIFPNVMSPKYDRSAQMLISMMPSQERKDVLEIGSGTGVLSLFVGLQGARSITAVDINEAVVENTVQNLERYGIENFKVHASDLFEAVDGTFDTIIFNAPFHGNKAEDVLELGTSDCDYQTLTRFLKDAGSYLREDAQILLGFADTGDNDLLEKLLDQFGYEISDFKTYPNGDWTMYLYILKVPETRRLGS